MAHCTFVSLFEFLVPPIFTTTTDSQSPGLCGLTAPPCALPSPPLPRVKFCSTDIPRLTVLRPPRGFPAPVRTTVVFSAPSFPSIGGFYQTPFPHPPPPSLGSLPVSALLGNLHVADVSGCACDLGRWGGWPFMENPRRL